MIITVKDLKKILEEQPENAVILLQNEKADCFEEITFVPAKDNDLLDDGTPCVVLSVFKTK